MNFAVIVSHVIQIDGKIDIVVCQIQLLTVWHCHIAVVVAVDVWRANRNHHLLRIRRKRSYIEGILGRHVCVEPHLYSCELSLEQASIDFDVLDLLLVLYHDYHLGACFLHALWDHIDCEWDSGYVKGCE